ncbi:MAG: hypothetical protein ACM3MK_11270 [Chitinophagales bacterium]
MGKLLERKRMPRPHVIFGKKTNRKDLLGTPGSSPALIYSQAGAWRTQKERSNR